jgi:hypothetical protein
MKNILFTIPLAAAIAGHADAASILFENPPYPDAGAANAAIDGVDGWTQSEPNEDDAEFPLFYTLESGGNQFGYLSGFYAAPNAASFSANRAVDLGPAPNLGETTFSMSVSIQESTNSFPENDTFGFSLSDGTNPLLDVLFVPTELTGAAEWEIFYTVAGSGQVDTNQALLPTGLYGMTVAFNSSGLDFSYGSSSGGTPTTVSGTPTGYDSTSTNDLGLSLDWEITSGNSAYGDGGMLVDGIETVPETSVFGLVALAGAGLLRRRRRVA